ncbi:hypothetical protein KQH62_05540 [bacterium]|nr:hypothetical protein [bacterium]
MLAIWVWDGDSDFVERRVVLVTATGAEAEHYLDVLRSKTCKNSGLVCVDNNCIAKIKHGGKVMLSAIKIVL